MKTNKRHPVVKAIGILFGLLFCSAIAVGAFFGLKGYTLYQDAISQTPIEATVEEIRRDEHFVKYTDLSDFYIKAVISVEDHRFWKHPGIDLIAIGRAAWTDLKTLSFKEGGSTITQQLVKNLLFTQEKSIERKAAEVFAAFDMEKRYEKEEILELYVNTAYFGSGYYGIYAAAQGYFDKDPAELTDYEAAMLAGLPNAPSAYSPDTNPDLAAKRVTAVLHSMVRNDLLTETQAEKIQNGAAS